jgi:hypothetical protein
MKASPRDNFLMKHFSSEIKNPRCKLRCDRTDEAYCREKVKEDKLDRWVAPSWSAIDLAREHTARQRVVSRQARDLELAETAAAPGKSGAGVEKTRAR